MRIAHIQPPKIEELSEPTAGDELSEEQFASREDSFEPGPCAVPKDGDSTPVVLGEMSDFDDDEPEVNNPQEFEDFDEDDFDDEFDDEFDDDFEEEVDDEYEIDEGEEFTEEETDDADLEVSIDIETPDSFEGDENELEFDGGAAGNDEEEEEKNEAPPEE